MRLRGRPELQSAALIIYSASTIAMLGTAAMSPILPVMLVDLALTEQQVSLMMTLFTLPVVVFVPIVGWLADRVGRKPVLTVSLFIFGLSGVLIAFTESFRVILALRMIQGVGFSGIVPLVVVIVGDLFDGADEVGAQGMRVTFVNLGTSTFPILTGALAEIDWNLPFFLFGAAIPAGLLVLWHLPESSSFESPPRGYVRKVLGSAVDRIVAGALAVGSIRFFLLYGLYTFLPVLIVRQEISAAEAGLVVGAMNAVKMVAATQSRRSLSLGAPHFTMVVCLLAATIAIGTFFVADGLLAFVLIAAVVGGADGVVAPLQKSVLTQNVPQQIRAGMISFNAMLQNAAKTVGPITFGVVIGFTGLPAAFPAVAGGTAVFVVLLAVFLSVPRSRPDPESS